MKTSQGFSEALIRPTNNCRCT